MNIIRSMTNLFILFALFGCIALPSTQPKNDSGMIPGCKTVTSSEPYNELVCQNISRMEEVCQTRDLNYSLTKEKFTDACVENNLCTYHYSNGTCAINLCSKGSARCLANLTNMDNQKAGTWSVAANFTLPNGVFSQNPITKTLLPNETATFDFSLFYDLNFDQSKPTCSIFVKSPARLQDCNFITKIEQKCDMETKYKTIEKQVCD